jgi:hypothetical protein
MTKSIFIIREPKGSDPKWTVYIDDDEQLARNVAESVQQCSGQTLQMDRRLIDISIFKNPQDYQGTRYWVV